MPVYLRVSLTRYAVRDRPLVRLAERVLSAAGEAQAELSLELIGNRRMRRLNRAYRKQDRVTDVLAFPTREAIVPHGLPPQAGMLGDVVISLPTAVRQAKRAGRSANDELAMLLVHGVLHLCGYDHERNAQEAAKMFRREQAILRRVSPVPRLITIHTRRRTKDC